MRLRVTITSNHPNVETNLSSEKMPTPNTLQGQARDKQGQTSMLV